MARPAGTVTFLFSDIEGSTRLWESSPESMRLALARHDAIVRAAVEDRGGYVFATGGDGFAVAFNRVGDALSAAATAQDRLTAEPWPKDAVIRVRMGLHTGEATERDGDYFGAAVNRAARLMATAHGGQVVCSLATASLADRSTHLRPLGQHRLRDLAAPEQVFQLGGAMFPILRSVDAVPTNLPTMRTELVGRTKDVRSLEEIVGRDRLLTLTGVGGVGKTRLALAVAGAVAPGYEDGCWLIDLAPLADGADVARTVATTIGAPVPDAVALASYLADRHMLIVLDNCEHVIGDVADHVESVLSVAGEVHVITTSREPLGLEGEVVRRVGSLALPDGDATTEAALGTAAVRLFMDRACAVAEGFSLDAATVEPVVEICRRLDGIPLAIELAASRIRSMPPVDLARRLDERFRLLGGGSRRAQERHRTLLATVSWSYDLLLPEEQEVFSRLAVFPASFTLEAAEAVTGHDESTNVTSCLFSLVDRSLVQFNPEEGRYHLLETLRQFAADRLAESGETAMRRERHARFFLDLVERCGPYLSGPDYLSAFTALTRETENLRATAAWCIDDARWAELALLSHCTFFMAIQSSPADGIAWRRQIIDRRTDLDDAAVIEALSEAAYLHAQVIGDYPASLDAAQGAFALAASTGREPSPWASAGRATALSMAARFDEAVTEGEQSLRLADAVGDDACAVIVLCVLSAALLGLGEPERSTRTAADALRRAEALGHPGYIASAVITHAACYLLYTSPPDFELSLAMLERCRDAPTADVQYAMWFDLFWGWSLLGLDDMRSVDWLAAAIFGADRLNAQHVMDLALRLLAVALERCGSTKEAATIALYANENLVDFRITAAGQSWVEDQLDRAGISGIAPDGFQPKRGDIMALVKQTAFSIAQRSNG